jgi:L-aminopeptidase/D-esterase-like protein
VLTVQLSSPEQNFPGLVAGNYTLTLQDAAGCSVSTGVTVTQPSPVSATASVNNAGCNGATDGVVNISGTAVLWLYV